MKFNSTFIIIIGYFILFKKLVTFHISFIERVMDQ